MSTDYYLVNHSNKTLFELGSYFPREIVSGKKLSNNLHDLLQERFENFDIIDPVQYAQEVEDKIVAFSRGGELEVVDDSDSDVHELRVDKKYNVIASRFVDFDLEATRKHEIYMRTGGRVP